MQLKENFVKQYCNYGHNIDVGKNIILTVGVVEGAVNSLKKEKSAGQDNKTAEYLQFASGRVIYF